MTPTVWLYDSHVCGATLGWATRNKDDFAAHLHTQQIGKMAVTQAKRTQPMTQMTLSKQFHYFKALPFWNDHNRQISNVIYRNTHTLGPTV